MLIVDGLFLGNGSLVRDGLSLGESLTCDLKVTGDDQGITLAGELTLKETSPQAFSIRIGANDVGTYIIDAVVLGVGFDGIAKLESEPNLAMLWTESGNVQASVTLFRAKNGIGCRGFVRDDHATNTWEIAFGLKQTMVKGDNVVSFSNRRKR